MKGSPGWRRYCHLLHLVTLLVPLGFNYLGKQWAKERTTQQSESSQIEQERISLFLLRLLTFWNEISSISPYYQVVFRHPPDISLQLATSYFTLSNFSCLLLAQNQGLPYFLFLSVIKTHHRLPAAHTTDSLHPMPWYKGYQVGLRVVIFACWCWVMPVKFGTSK